MASLNERVRRLGCRIKPPASPEPGPVSRRYKRMVTHMNHRRAVLDHEDRKGMAEAGDGRLEVLEPPEPLPPPTLDDMRDDLESSLRFLNEYIPSWRAEDRGPESRALVDDMERHAQESVERLRREIRAKEGSES